MSVAAEEFFEGLVNVGSVVNKKHLWIDAKLDDVGVEELVFVAEHGVDSSYITREW